MQYPTRRTAAAMLLPLAGMRGEQAPGAATIRVAVCAAVVRGVNENDAQAAMEGWASAVNRQSGGKLYYTMQISGPEGVVQAMRRHEVEAAAITMLEFAQLAPVIDPTHIVSDVTCLHDAERYLVLVRADSGIQSLAGLRGKLLVSYSHPYTTLAEPWLALRLEAENLPAPEALFTRFTRADKLSRGVVLPVFFRQADACLVHKRGFEAMVELNPQLGKQLRPIATSPMLIPSMMVFHRNAPQVSRELLLSTLRDLAKSEVGKQLQTLFQVKEFAIFDMAAMQPSLDILARAAKLKARAGGARP